MEPEGTGGGGVLHADVDRRDVARAAAVVVDRAYVDAVGARADAAERRRRAVHVLPAAVADARLVAHAAAAGVARHVPVDVHGRRRITGRARGKVARRARLTVRGRVRAARPGTPADAVLGTHRERVGRAVGEPADALVDAGRRGVEHLRPAVPVHLVARDRRVVGRRRSPAQRRGARRRRDDRRGVRRVGLIAHDHRDTPLSLTCGILRAVLDAVDDAERAGERRARANTDAGVGEAHGGVRPHVDLVDRRGDDAQGHAVLLERVEVVREHIDGYRLSALHVHRTVVVRLRQRTRRRDHLDVDVAGHGELVEVDVEGEPGGCAGLHAEGR